MTRKRKELNTTPLLPAGEVTQVLTEVTFGKRIMTRRSVQSWSEIYHGLMPVEIDGWQLTLSINATPRTTVSAASYLRVASGHSNSDIATTLILKTY